MIDNVLIFLYFSHLTIFWLYGLIWTLATDTKFHQESQQVAKYALKIQICILPWCGLLFKHFYDPEYNEYILQLPDFSLFEVFQFITMILYQDFMFYHIHRLFHLPQFYKFHKLHHTWSCPVPWESLYSSIPENILSNFLPVFSAPIIVRLKLFYLPLWVFLSTFSSLLAHSNYDFFHHTLHHRLHNVNYGTAGLFDIIYRTYKAKE